MSVQVFYKNKAKLSGPGVIALFGNEKFQIKNLKSSFSKSEASYIEKILKNNVQGGRDVFWVCQVGAPGETNLSEPTRSFNF